MQRGAQHLVVDASVIAFGDERLTLGGQHRQPQPAKGVRGDYLSSLDRLVDVGGAMVCLPAHGPDLPDVATVAREYREHRGQRLDQVRDALAVLGQDATARAVVEHVYRDVDESLWGAAEMSVIAQLEYLRG